MFKFLVELLRPRRRVSRLQRNIATLASEINELEERFMNVAAETFDKTGRRRG